LKPYFLTGENTTSVYFSHFTPAEWKIRSKTYPEFPYNNRNLEEYSTDCFRFSDIKYDPRRELKGENIGFKVYEGRKCIEAKNGWFSFKMKTSSEKQMELVCTYWGDPAENGYFDIFIDNEFLSTVSIHRGEKKFISRRFHLPLDYNLQKNELTVSFIPHPGMSVGPVSECRLLTYNRLSPL
jgi:hypothetical protein